MEIFEQLINTKSINLIIGVTLIVLAVIAIVWMYSWFKKAKEYDRILKSIDDKVEACSNEEIKKELKVLTNKDNNSSNKASVAKDTAEGEKAAVTVQTEKPAEPVEKHNFNRAMAAIENLEKDQSEQEKVSIAKIQAAKVAAERLAVEAAENEAKAKAEKLAAEKAAVEAAAKEKAERERLESESFESGKLEKETAESEKAGANTVAKKQVAYDEEKVAAAMAEAEKIKNEISKVARASKENSVSWEDTGSESKATNEPIAMKTDDDDDECAIDVFAEIRKMLVETEKTSMNDAPVQPEESGNIAKSGKEYTREELENLIKF